MPTAHAGAKEAVSYTRKICLAGDMKRIDPIEIEFGIVLAIVASALLYGIGSALVALWR
ncbi:hypothetical protein ACFQRC_07355 [Enterovirga sp. GCM10030262]|uniref:hypothetical protein n=1 Tax=Enterovirga sp. GCM10030262 TaxID=3273391 RepID=UPI00361F1CEC